ncbi:MAG: ribonuclease III, partial [Leeuwenhoekiella sp.]|nr:ribonuclease III [Leeuwenhoekiella sp.]
MSAIRNIFTSRPEKDGNFFATIKAIIGFKPRNIRHYEEAFTHRSMGLQNSKGHAFNYERLEFLGDAM